MTRLPGPEQSGTTTDGTPDDASRAARTAGGAGPVTREPVDGQVQSVQLPDGERDGRHGEIT
jgi:hypothetical protein